MSRPAAALRDDPTFCQWLVSACGYSDPRMIGQGRYACIKRGTTKVAIVVGFRRDRFQIENAWSYHTYESALAALEAWDGRGAPAGWFDCVRRWIDEGADVLYRGA